MDVAALNQLSEHLAKQGVLRRVDSRGEAEELPMEAALRAASKKQQADDWAGQLMRAQQLSDLAAMPIVGVMGQLNVGKSSVVASFLGENGKDLIPRGIMNDSGTHRFVYWLPGSWSQGEKWDILEKMLAKVHGSKMERMHVDDPEAVRIQYQAGLKDPEVMQVPLLAFDESLNQIGCAFLDCPDVQTRDQAGDDSMPRLTMVRAAARICSVFLVVWERKQVRERLLNEFLKLLREQCPGVPVHLLLNYLAGEKEPTKTLLDSMVQELLDTYQLGGKKTHSFYGAFNFGDKEALKQEPEVFQTWRKRGWEFPGFFRVDASLEPYDPQKVENERMLLSLPQHLDSGELQAQQLEDSLEKLPDDHRRYCEDLEAWSMEENEQSKDLRKDLYHFCQQIFTHDSQTGKLGFNQEFQESLQQSFLANAPEGLKWPAWFCRPIYMIRPKLRKLGERLFRKRVVGEENLFTSVLPDWMQKGLKFTRKPAEEPPHPDQMSLEEIVNKARACPCFNEAIVDGKGQLLEEAWKTIINDFQNWLLQDKVDPEEIDAITRQFWECADESEKQKAGRKIWFEFFLSMAGYVTLSLSALDGGATALMLTSISEMLPGLALLGGGLLGAGGAVLVDFFNEKSNHQFQKFFSLACARFGLPPQIPKDLAPNQSPTPFPNPASPAQSILNLGPGYYWESIFDRESKAHPMQ